MYTRSRKLMTQSRYFLINFHESYYYNGRSQITYIHRFTLHTFSVDRIYDDQKTAADARKLGWRNRKIR